jgi:hypothetical protein
MAGGTVMKNSVICMVAAFLAFCVSAQGSVEIQPTNCVIDIDSFSFDFVISQLDSVSAFSFHTVIGVTGPGTLSLDPPGSEVVSSDPDYWILGNSTGAGAIDLGSNSYQFGDSSDDGNPETLLAGDIVARYAFDWDGTIGDYTFTLDLDSAKSFVQNQDFVKEGLLFSPGEYQGGSDFFTVSIPEPATLVVFALGGSILLKKRRK